MTRKIGIGVLTGALIVLAGSRSQAQLAPLKQTVAPGTADGLASQSVQAELAGDHPKALQLAEDAIKSDPKNPWGRFAKGDALGSLQRTDDAASAFREAEQHYSDAEMWGKSIAIWGQANAFFQAGRCQDSSPLYERYASFVEKVDPEAAALARRFEKSCMPHAATH
jgi:tetratricopeptide (TPR) repeat protein